MVRAKTRPIVIITSNNEKELPDAFLRRCFFHYIQFPDRETLAQIVDVHYPDLDRQLLQEALAQFEQVRQLRGLKKKPSTSELLDWIKLLLVQRYNAEGLRQALEAGSLPLAGTLIKNEQDLELLRYLNQYR